jgi:large subunit ribosomal protein L23
MSQILLIPKVSEKSFKLAGANVYMFNVPIDANKIQIKAAVESEYKVTVLKVNVSVAKGKAKKSFRKGQQPVDGVRKDTKRAYVTLKDGDKIPFFEEVE